MLKDSELEQLKQRLIEQRSALLSRLRRRNNARQANTMKPMNPDPADLAQDYSLQDRNSALRDRMEEKLTQIKDALRRIEDGEYGKCLHCGKVIAPARLQALPYAELCIDCQTEQEKKEIHR